MLVPLKPEALREGLRLAMDALHRRRASEIDEALIDRLVELDWLEWHGGSLRLTTTGDNIYRQEMAQWRERNERAAAAETKKLTLEAAMAKPNYQFEKRQREMEKKKKKQEKELEKAHRKANPDAAAADGAEAPDGAEPGASAEGNEAAQGQPANEQSQG